MTTELENEKSKNFSKKAFFTGITASFFTGALLLFGVNQFLKKDQTGIPFIQKDKATQAKFGGDLSKEKAQAFTDVFSTYLSYVDRTEFNVSYTAGTWFTAKEIGNFLIKINNENPTIPDSLIRLYFCTGMYPNQTPNPYTGRTITGPKLGTFLIATKNSSSLAVSGTVKLNIKNNPNVLGCYNWGSLEP